MMHWWCEVIDADGVPDVLDGQDILDRMCLDVETIDDAYVAAFALALDTDPADAIAASEMEREG